MDGQREVLDVRAHLECVDGLGDKLAGVHSDDACAQQALRLRLEEQLGQSVVPCKSERPPRCAQGKTAFSYSISLWRASVSVSPIQAISGSV